MPDILNILVIDDEEPMRDSCSKLLSKDNFNVSTAEDGLKGLELLNHKAFDIVILDLKMPGLSGLEVLEKIKQNLPDMLVIVITGYPSVESAVQAMKAGAYDFLPKPFTPDELRVIVKRAADKRRLIVENIYLREQLKTYTSMDEIIGESESMIQIKEMIRKVGPTDSTVLITGESGTGKDIVARAIHQHSLRKNKPFVTVDCGSLVSTLFESELFGHIKGSFTDAVATRKGKFELANSGTIFFDEIANIDLNVQSKLLRAIQEKEITKVGSNQILQIDVRIISATNRDLAKAIKEGSFREDLFYRLGVIPIFLPPLRQKKDDIPLLIRYFLDKYSKRKNKKISGITNRAINELIRYNWPGNVRELQNTIERAVVLAKSDLIDHSDLFYYPLEPHHSSDNYSLGEVEKAHISKILYEMDFNITRTAELLEIDRKTLRAKIKKYGIKIVGRNSPQVD
ncbi:sigma-54-dependent Fis family transcriptional regulator [bacterium]|nr:sigma-54-dependent Fis family transcriptional regulator [bacterium]